MDADEYRNTPLSERDFIVFVEQQKTKRTVLRWSFGGGIFLVFSIMVTIAGLAH